MTKLRAAILVLLVPAVLASQSVVDPAMLNYVEGKVLMAHLPNSDAGDSSVLESGQHIRTEEGRAEMYFAFDSLTFLRLGENAHLEIVELSADSATVRLHTGAMIVETFATRAVNPVSVQVGGAEATLVVKGEFRFEAKSERDWSMQPLMGRAVVSEAGTELHVKKGWAAQPGTQGLQMSKAKKLQDDSITEWHKERSKKIGNMTAVIWASHGNAGSPKSEFNKGLPGVGGPRP